MVNLPLLYTTYCTYMTVKCKYPFQEIRYESQAAKLSWGWPVRSPIILHPMCLHCMPKGCDNVYMAKTSNMH